MLLISSFCVLLCCCVLAARCSVLPAATEEEISYVQSLLHPMSLDNFLSEVSCIKPAVLRRRNPNFYKSLFDMQEVDDILLYGKRTANNSAPLLHGKDYRLVRRVFRDGEYWTGVITSTNVSLPDAKSYFNQGFTLIIDEVQAYSPAVQFFAQMLEAVLGWRVNVNLYLSPVKSQGFEAHFDWMDSLILQIVGAKHWQVHTEPYIPYPRVDLVAKPNATLFSEAPDDLVLSAGDLLYMPRGFVHQATTNSSAASMREPSLHLTFGIETATHFSVEVFLHHVIAVSPFSFSQDALPLQSDNEIFSLRITRTDLYHIVVAAIAGRSDSEVSVLLRRTVGVTSIASDYLRPCELLVAALRELRRIDDATNTAMSEVLTFLARTNRLATSSGTLISVADSRHAIYQSADFACTYLNTFLGANKRYSIAEIQSQQSGNRASSSDILRASWKEASRLIWQKFQELLASLLQEESSCGSANDSIYSTAWKNMLESIQRDATQRLSNQIATMRASGKEPLPQVIARLQRLQAADEESKSYAEL